MLFNDGVIMYYVHVVKNVLGSFFVFFIDLFLYLYILQEI